MEDSKLFVDLKPLTDEEIKSKNFGLEDLWMVKVTGKDPYGPYDTESLKDYADKYEFLFENAKVYNLDTDEWSDMFALPHFQRRKPQLVSAQNLIKTQDFYILFNGQKDGPHSQNKVQQLLDEGHILSSTQISLDKGQSWIKLYEHHAFDRRTKKSNQELPFKPNEDILQKVKNKKAQIIKLKEAEDAIVEFAYLGTNDHEFEFDNKNNLELETNPNINLKHKLHKEEINKLKKLKKSKRVNPIPQKKSYAMKFASLGILFAAIGFGFYQYTIETETSATQITKSKTEDSRSIDNSERQNFKKVQKIQRMPASVKRKPAVVNRVKKKKAPRRIQRRAPKRYVQKEAPELKEVFERDIENIDIDDPEIKEELSRQLAGEYENEEEDIRDEREEKEELEEENPYAREDLPEDNYQDEEPVSHDDY